MPALDTDSIQLPLIPLQKTFHASCNIFAVFPTVLGFIFLPSFVPFHSPTRTGFFSPLSLRLLRVHTLFILSLKSSHSDLSRKNKLSDCTVIREIIHIKHSPCEHGHNKSSFKILKHSAVTGRGIAYLLKKWPFYSSARFNQAFVSVISARSPFASSGLYELQTLLLNHQNNYISF